MVGKAFGELREGEEMVGGWRQWDWGSENSSEISLKLEAVNIYHGRKADGCRLNYICRWAGFYFCSDPVNEVVFPS